MSAENVRIKYTGSALPGNAETVTIFDTTKLGSSTAGAVPIANFAALAGLNRLYVTFINDAAGTLKSYSSENGGTTWTQISSTAVAASAGNADTPFDYLIEPYQDWKLEWLNGATPQTTFRVAAALQGQRNPGV